MLVMTAKTVEQASAKIVTLPFFIGTILSNQSFKNIANYISENLCTTCHERRSRSSRLAPDLRYPLGFFGYKNAIWNFNCQVGEARLSGRLTFP
jgi:hypothetical protein